MATKRKEYALKMLAGGMAGGINDGDLPVEYDTRGTLAR